MSHRPLTRDPHEANLTSRNAATHAHQTPKRDEAAFLRSGLRRCLVLIAVAITSSLLRAETFDVIIRGAQIIDGSGSLGRSGDIGINRDRIIALGDLRTATARTEIDARGLIAAPGFIDGHSHLGDHELVRPELAGAVPMLAQGVTTVFINADGWGVVDLASQRSQIEQAHPGVNAAPMLGHKAVRIAVLRFADRAPLPAELAQMRDLVRTAFQRDGAFGLSTGLLYPPANFAKTDELVELARVAGESGGYYHSHIRDESDSSVGLLPAVEEVVTIAERAKVTGIVTHIKAAGPKTWGKSAAIIQKISAARAAGIAVWADQYPYEASTTLLSAMLLPPWAQADGPDRTRERLADPATRAKIRDEVVGNIARRAGPGAFLISRFLPDPKIEGKRLDEIARQRGVEPADLVIDLLRQGEPVTTVFSMQRDDIVAFMRQPWTMTASDGFGMAEANPRSYGTFARKLRVYALDEKIISLERAIHSMTGQPAEVLGLRDRGVLRAGAFADVVIFDPAKLRDTATYESPHALAEGMVHVFINGKPALTDGKITGLRAGRVLRRE